jgi:hypothetical protein
VKTTEMSINGYMEKQNTMYPYHAILLLQKKERSTDMCYNIAKP